MERYFYYYLACVPLCIPSFLIVFKVVKRKLLESVFNQQIVLMILLNGKYNRNLVPMSDQIDPNFSNIILIFFLQDCTWWWPPASASTSCSPPVRRDSPVRSSSIWGLVTSSPSWRVALWQWCSGPHFHSFGKNKC